MNKTDSAMSIWKINNLLESEEVEHFGLIRY